MRMLYIWIFFENPDYASVFSGSLEPDNIVMMLSALLGKNAIFETGKTVLILDEIQDCPEARTALKFFPYRRAIRCHRYRFAARCKGLRKGTKIRARRVWNCNRYVSAGFWRIFMGKWNWTSADLYTGKLSVRGKTSSWRIAFIVCVNSCCNMPSLAVCLTQLKRFLSIRIGLDRVLQIQRDIVRSYKDDMIKYADKKDKSCITECFESIPRQLAKENKNSSIHLSKKELLLLNMQAVFSGLKKPESSRAVTTFLSPNYRWTAIQSKICLRYICVT